MSVRAAEFLMGLVMLAISVAVMLKSAELNIGWISERGPGSGAWPFWLAVGMALASVAVLVRWALGLTPEARNREPYIDPDTQILVAITALALLVMIAAIAYIGMYLAFLLFLLFYLKVVGRHDWSQALAIAVGMPVFIYLLFEVALTKYLPKGLPAFENAFLAIDDIRYQIQYHEQASMITGAMALWALAALGVAIWASRRGRDGPLAFLAALVLTPVGGALLYHLLGRAEGHGSQPG